MSYTSKFTGEEIDNILTLAKEFGDGISSNVPVGTIIPYMGLTAPQDYLVCDGAVLNISDYPKLAEHFENHFGSKNHFGGDGTTTFAIPDLRNEFLRGYHNGKEEQLSGEIGIHQNATSQQRMYVTTGNQVAWYVDQNTDVSNTDTKTNASTGYRATTTQYTPSGTAVSTYTSRPTNVAVLFCIKCTESVCGSSNSDIVAGTTKSVLFEGKHLITANTSSDKNLLSDNIKNYDYIALTTGQEVPSGTYSGMIFEQNTILIDTSSIYVKDGMPATISQWVSEFDRSGNYEYLVTGNFGDGTQLVIAKFVPGSTVTSRNHYITKVVGFKNVNGSVSSNNVKKSVLFDGEFAAVGSMSKVNLLSDNIFNYDEIHLTTYQKVDGGVKYRFNTSVIDVSNMRVSSSTSLWTSSVFYPTYGYYLSGNFGDGTQLYINESNAGTSVTDREHGICKVVGIKY